MGRYISLFALIAITNCDFAPFTTEPVSPELGNGGNEMVTLRVVDETGAPIVGARVRGRLAEHFDTAEDGTVHVPVELFDAGPVRVFMIGYASIALSASDRLPSVLAGEPVVLRPSGITPDVCTFTGTGNLH